MERISKESVGIRPGTSLSESLKYLLYCVILTSILAIPPIYISNLTYTESLIISQCMALSIFACAMFVINYIKPLYLSTHIVFIIVAVAVGSIIGALAANFASGVHDFGLIKLHHFLPLVIAGFFYGVLFAFLFNFWGLLSETIVFIKQEKLKQLINEKKLLESDLRLLQAQIEPHFLFNTLSSTRSLLDTDVEEGKIMLDDLTQYLRASLSKIRHETTTISQEMEIIHAYMCIFKIRLKERLEYAIEIPNELKDHPLPSMLVQPLVENAIKHGIEPKIEGGSILIAFTHQGEDLRIEVNDTGLGLNENIDAGVGLTNIRERLDSLFGSKGKLLFEENIPCGIKAVIKVPYVR